MMDIPIELIIAYLFGGITLLPTIALAVLIHAHYTFPTREPGPSSSEKEALHSLPRSIDDHESLLSGLHAEELAEEFRRSHEPDVAAGYFAVCREYVPGGINGKPPERTTPAGSVISAESPSVYQSMYRSIFDRKQPLTLDPGKANGRAMKRARNVFFVVLRHGHLMLYEDFEQVEVKHVISLEHHDVGLYAGGDTIPEGELWIKRNAIRLSKRSRHRQETSKPFFLFSDNCSEKEDFYFALLRNQDVGREPSDRTSRPTQFDPSHVIGLVKRLHSSEEQLQTRWFNGLIGRLFLAIYRNADTEDFVRKKITKKIARVKKPAFLSDIVLRKIDLGESAPQLLNPRLKDLTIDGDCCVEGDLRYTGNLRLEIAATARLDLGARFKAREVNLVLAVVVKKLHGHALLKFKPPPSNRIWVTFEQMPDMELSIEPIVSSRQITYGVILRAIESRIREVLAETLVLPHWDDCPFTDTVHQAVRGGIWGKANSATEPHLDHAKIPDEAPEDEVRQDEEKIDASHAQFKNEGPVNMRDLSSDDVPPVFENHSRSPKVPPKGGNELDLDLSHQKAEKPPKALRSTSFASAADPLLSNASADSTKRERIKGKKEQKDATSAMIAISNRSRPTSPNESCVPTFLHSPLDGEAEKGTDSNSVNTAQPHGSFGQLSPSDISGPTTPVRVGSPLIKSSTEKDSLTPPAAQLRSTPGTPPNKKQSIAAIGAATAAAKKWGWGVIARNVELKDTSVTLDPDRAGTPRNPIGRGQPLPPLGQPLPAPSSQRAKTMPPPAPQRKALPMLSPPKQPSQGSKEYSPERPPLPARRRQSSMPLEIARDEGLLVVEAPFSEPPSPTEEVEVLATNGGGESENAVPPNVPYTSPNGPTQDLQNNGGKLKQADSISGEEREGRHPNSLVVSNPP